ncbi:MAG: diguanylate cyclase with and sensor [Pelosinus sp.]|nr:diguanylate cyclase with and sensor [Pelosinus sp.]
MDQRFKILIAEDSKLERLMLRNNLVSWGYQVYEAANGKDAIAMFDEVNPDLVILDGIMPEMDGYAVCEYLQEHKKRNRTPIILITAYDNEEAVERAFAAGAGEYLTKPVYWNVLKYRIKRILQARQAEVALGKSEEKLQGILNNAVVGIGMVDAGGNCIYANQKLVDMLGYSLEELYTIGLKQVAHSDEWPTTSENLRQMVNKERFECHIERRYIRKDQTVFWARLSATVVYDEDHEIESLIGIVIDITDRKAMDAQISLQNQYLLALNEVSLQLLNRLDLDHVLAMIVTHAVNLFHNASGSLYLLQSNGSHVELKFAIGLEEKDIGAIQYKDEGIIGEVFRTGETVIMNDYQQWSKRMISCDTEYNGVFICMPLFSDKKVVGVIYIYIDEPGWVCTEEQKFLLERFIGLASIAYDNAILYKLAQEEIAERKLVEGKLRYVSMHDSLTGLYNRTYFEDELQRISNASYDSVGIIVCDVDDLKAANDTLGHAFGDALIIAAATALKQACRKSDTVARIGGDEFVVLLPEPDDQIIQEICQRTGEQIQRRQRSIDGKIMRLSMGWAIHNGPGLDMQELFKEADKNMYCDKMLNKIKKT